MATADTYSRVVFWLKLTLPLLALAILSTLFFVAETLDPEAAIPYAKVDVARILREQGATAPNFGTVTSNGVAIALSATAIRPGQNNRDHWLGTVLEAELTLPSGAMIFIDSPEGLVDAAREEAILKGGATLRSSNGFRVETQVITARLSDATVTAEEGVVAYGPPGQITAGRMTLRQIKGDLPTHHLVFQDGVRLIYTPPN